jgi:hypothetical protein
MSSPSNESSVPEGHVALVLLREGDSDFHLQIPLDIISSLCLTPRKYLLFLAWCILGVEGVLALEHGGDEIDTDGDLEEQEVYHYVPVAGLGTFLSCHACTQDTCGMLFVQRRSRPCCRHRGHQGQDERAFGIYADP